MAALPLFRFRNEPRWVSWFGEGDGSRRDLLGGKGAGLEEMTSIGLPIPHGFTITTDACKEFYRAGKRLPDGLWVEVLAALRRLEDVTGAKLGDPSMPLLVSVRSGAAISMPGMMDTILNLGINSSVAEAMGQQTNNPRFALDLHRRFIEMFGSVVLGVDGKLFQEAIEARQDEVGVGRSADLSPDDLTNVISAFQRIVADATGNGVPDDPYVQLEQSIAAVFDSWNTRRAVAYREYHGIPHDLGTAVNVVTMVYGNKDERSGTGVLFTRDPATGRRSLRGEYLANAQGEDVVAGAVTPSDISALSETMPEVYRTLVKTTETLERHYRDVQDVEFTVEQGKLYILQTRTAQRSAKAAVTTAVDMAMEGLIRRDEALLRVEPQQIYQLLLPRFEDKAKDEARSDGRLLTKGLGTSPGAATGEVVFDADTAAERGAEGASVILARTETSPDDVHGMVASAGILTSRGGATSHAAVVATGMGKPCITAAESIEIDSEKGLLRCGDILVEEGEDISIDGATGEVFIGPIATTQPNVDDEAELSTLLDWADDARTMGVWANADTPQDATIARDFGAEGVGLCRTEHMFFEPERLSLVREMIIAAHRSVQSPEDEVSRGTYLKALGELQKMQVTDFEGIFQAMAGRPVVIRLLDPPLHEFLPKYDELLTEAVRRQATEGGPEDRDALDQDELLATVDEMREVNPMLGLRGCRVGLIYPEIYDMQMQAILQAAHNVATKDVVARPEIMVPLVSHVSEMQRIRARLEQVAETFADDTGSNPDYKIGAMVETPRAALTAGQIAEEAEFLSFGTNDLSQLTFGFSRDDAEGKFLSRYGEMGVLEENPFQTIDREGVGLLVEMACADGRQTRRDIKLGICGEHGGEPASIEFLHRLGLDYVSCSPYRVPVARLAAAQAELRSAAKNETEVTRQPELLAVNR